jgi:WD40 repeat protein
MGTATGLARFGTAIIWSGVSGSFIRALTHPGNVWLVDWSPDGTRLAAIMGTAPPVWNVATGANIYSLVGHTDGVWTMAWSPDGTRLATGSADGTARIWSA